MLALMQGLMSLGAGGGASFASAVLGLTPWGYWRLDETGTLTTAADSSGSARNGTYTGAGTTDVAGLFGGSVRAKTFSATGAVTCPTYTAAAGSPFSVLCAFNVTSTANMALLSGDNTAPTERMYQLRSNNGFLQFLALSPSTVTVQSPLAYNDNLPHLAVAVFDQSLPAADGRMKLYVDGAEVARTTTAITNDQTSAPLAIAQLGSGSTLIRLNGTIDECAFFNYALSAAQVSALWAARNSGGGSDPFFSSVAALLKLDSSLADVTGKTWTATGTAAISSAQSRFGGASLEMTSTGTNRIDCSSADFNFGTDPYTIEGFFWPESATNRAFFSFGSRLVYTASSLWAYFDGSSNAITGGSVSSGNWVHIALCRQAGGDTRLFVDGVQVGSTFSENVAINPAAMRLGHYNGGNPAGRYYDEFRVTRGVARYTANFTPPTAPFPTS